MYSSAMNTRLLLSLSAICMGVAGAGATFAPHELLQLAEVGRNRTGPVLVQLLGALLLSFAMTNWTARGSLLGGIYNRPLAIGNLLHFTMGALSLVRLVADGERSAPALAATFVYAVFAVWFGAAFFRSPVEPERSR